eukprot:scaffold11751_cov159-Amphora_coffeaeformis.AAC.1
MSWRIHLTKAGSVSCTTERISVNQSSKQEVLLGDDGKSCCGKNGSNGLVASSSSSSLSSPLPPTPSERYQLRTLGMVAFMISW